MYSKQKLIIFAIAILTNWIVMNTEGTVILKIFVRKNFQTFHFHNSIQLHEIKIIKINALQKLRVLIARHLYMILQHKFI